MTRRRALAAAVALAALGRTAAAQAPSPSPSPKPLTVEGAEVEVVSVTAVVYDKGGHFVRGLTPKNVTLLEDGVPQDVTIFREANGGTEKIPLSVVLVLDTSGSMKQNLGLLQEAAITFVDKLEDIDTALVVSFNETVKGSVDFTGDSDRLTQFVGGLQAWGGTSLYDAMRYSLDRIKNQSGRKALVVFTDGDDNTSSTKEPEVIDYARSVEATIYTVGINPGAGMGGGPNRGFLNRVAAETGGQSFFPDKVAGLIKIFSGISEELHNHYMLAYTPKRPADGTYRNIELRLDQKDLQVRVRKGYFALKRRKPRA